ncbi:sulfatase [Candidatus Latescibacterota bacterium]
MNRRTFIENTVTAAAGISSGTLLSTLGGCGKSAAATKKPNIVVIMLDDAGWKDFGYHGSEIKTPSIDRFAREGVELDNFYAYPTCSPTRASLMTGRPPSRVGVTSAVAAQHEETMIPKDTVTIAELLRRNGYSTGMSGKWHLGNTLELSPDNYGFDHAHGFLGPWVDFYTHRSQLEKVTWHRNGEYIEQEGHATDLIADEAISFITEHRDKDKPFFLYVPFNAPHLPLQEEQRWIEPYEGVIESESRRYYAAAVSHADHSIGRIISTLEKEGLGKDTLVIFFSDNGGEGPGVKNYLKPVPTYKTTIATDYYGDSGPLRGGKYSFYEGGIRVAAAMYWPGTLAPGKTVQPMIVYDILPTVAKLAGIDVPEEMNIEGMNVWPSVSDGESVGDRFFYWYIGNKSAIRKGDWKLIHTGRSFDAGKSELFNVAEDPYEKTECSTTHPGIFKELLDEIKHQHTLDLFH